jgi:autotransporter-associated beta strand protein
LNFFQNHRTHRGRSRLNSLLSTLLAVVFLTGSDVSPISSVASVMAAPITTWSGSAGNGNWSSAGNWSTLPTTSGTWGLVFGGTSQTSATNNIGTIQIDSLSFTNNGTAGKTASFTLSGSTLALSNATIVTTATTAGSALSDTVANALTLTGSNSITLGSGHSLSLSTGGISGSGSLTVDSSGGSATLFMSGSNTYSGGTLITGGQVRTAGTGAGDASNNNAFGTGSVIVSGSGSVALRNASSLSNNFTIGGEGLLGSGTQGAIRGSFSTSSRTASLSGTVTLSSNATITTAASNAVTNSRLELSGPIDLGSNILTLAPDLAVTNSTSAPIVISGTVGGTGSVVVAGNTQSTVLMSAANGYSGGTTLTSGTLQVGNGTALGVGQLLVNGGTLDLNAQALSVGALGGSSGGLITTSQAGGASLTTNYLSDATFGGRISDGAGVVSLTKNGPGLLYMTGSNSYSGTTSINGGQIRTGVAGSSDSSNNDAFGTSAVVVSGSGSVAIRNGTTLTNDFTIGGNGLSNSGTQGAIRGSFSTSDRTATIAGSITLSSSATIASAASSGVTGSQLVLSGPIDLGSHRLTFDPGVAASGTAAVPIVVTGSMTGTGDVLIAGSSTLYMNGVNSSTGSTTVRSGALGGDGSIAGVVTVETGATLTPGNAANTTGRLEVGGLQLNSGATAAMTIGGTASGLYDQVVALNNVAFGGNLAIEFTSNGFANYDSWQLFSGSTFSGGFDSVSAFGSYGSLVFSYLGSGEWKADLGGGQTASFYEDDSNAIGGRYVAGQLIVVPEPSTIAAAGIGLALVGLRRWLRRRAERRSSGVLCTGRSVA